MGGSLVHSGHDHCLPYDGLAILGIVIVKARLAFFINSEYRFSIRAVRPQRVQGYCRQVTSEGTTTANMEYRWPTVYMHFVLQLLFDALCSMRIVQWGSMDRK